MRIQNWRLRGEQFGALWHDTGQDRQPYPFALISSARTYNAFEQQQREIREAFAGDDRQDVRMAVRILAEPEVFVEISGETYEKKPIRIIGAQLQRWCAIAVQEPGPKPAGGGDVVLGSGIRQDLGALLIGQVPQNAAGKRTFARNDEPEEDFYSQDILRSAGASPASPRLEDVLRAGYAGRGTIRVFRGPRYVRGELGSARWVDIAGDGRYVVGPRDKNAAVPADPGFLASAVDSLITRGLREQRELAEQRW